MMNKQSKTFLAVTIMIAWLSGLSACAQTPLVETSTQLPTSTLQPMISKTPSPVLATGKPVTLDPNQTAMASPEQPVEPLITFEQTGGFAGRTSIYMIYADGSISINGKHAGAVNAQKVSDLLETLVELGITELSGNFLPMDTCCDRFIYTLTVNYAGSRYSITTIDASNDTPQAIWDMLAAVKELVKQVEL